MCMSFDYCSVFQSRNKRLPTVNLKYPGDLLMISLFFQTYLACLNWKNYYDTSVKCKFNITPNFIKLIC